MISAIDFIIMQNRIYKPDGVSFRRISEVAGSVWNRGRCSSIKQNF